MHGLCRRLGMLLRSVTVVFEQLPPDLDEVPEGDRVDDATMAIHSFIMNTYGCLDNMAWIWVTERAFRDRDGLELAPKRIGLGREYSNVRRALPDSFRTYLESLDPWFQHLKDFRDALAHRIPLYIPPFMVDSGDAGEYDRLEAQSNEALSRGDSDQYDRLQQEQRRYRFFRPWMTHSFHENAPKVVFHSQLLIDFKTISEIANKSLDEMSRGVQQVSAGS